MEITRIVASTDFSEEAKRGVTQAMRIARHTGASLLLAHAHPMNETQLDAAERSLGYVEEFREMLRRSLQAAHDRLAEERRRLGGQGVDVRQVLVDVPAERGLCAVAVDIHADLLVVASRGHTGIRRLLIGSVTEKLARTCPIPVLVARGDAGVGGYRRILVPVDFSELSEPSVRAACALAARGADVDLLHCFQVPLGEFGSVPDESPLPAPIQADLRTSVERRGRALAAAHRDPYRSLGFRTVTAPPVQGILERLDDGAYDLVVLGSLGRSGLGQHLLGNVAERTLRHAPCSTLIYRLP